MDALANPAHHPYTTAPPTMTLSLYVWTEFAPDYTDGLAFAIAEDETQARSLVQRTGLDPHDWGILQVLPLDAPAAFAVSGGG
jgi:hypothetical protein